MPANVTIHARARAFEELSPCAKSGYARKTTYAALRKKTPHFLENNAPGLRQMPGPDATALACAVVHLGCAAPGRLACHGPREEINAA
eukprot:7717699-Lingulodinium_polyedra.AAC.1